MSSEQMSRRELVTHVGAGMVGAALVTSVPGAQAQMNGSSTTAPFIDPTSKYPKPPYPGQAQPWPGLASKMNPRPDHGETSYKGSGRLRGRKALITGGDSGMGRAAAIAPEQISVLIDGRSIVQAYTNLRLPPNFSNSLPTGACEDVKAIVALSLQSP